MKVSKIFMLFLGLFLYQTTFANTIYLEYDPACMDRYEYQYKGVQNGLNHVVYHVRLNDSEKVILEVGIESKIDYETKPNDVTRCSEVSINERVVREINSGDLQVFIVKKSGKGYNVSPVGISTYAQISNRGVGFSTVDAKFAYDYSQPANGANLARKGSDSKVFYNGSLSHTCPKKYLFTKTKSKAGRNYTEMTIIPGIGVVEEKTGFNETDANNNVMELVTVNGIDLNKYINTYCRINTKNNPDKYFSNRKGTIENPPIRTIETNPIVDNNGTTTTTTETGTTTTTTPNGTVVTIPTNTGKCPIYKDLDRNLYIDRTTGQPANTSCGGNTFRNGYMVGESVVIGTTPGGTEVITSPPVVETNNTNTVDVDPGPSTYIYCKEVSTFGSHIVQPNETLYGIARQYGLSVDQIKSLNGLKSNVISPCQKIFTKPASEIPAGGADDILVAKDGKVYLHIVQRGETIYQIANKYGYTVDKFKSINGLTTNVINVGQRLRTSDCNCPTDELTSKSAEAVVDVTGEVPTTYGAEGGRIVVNSSPQKRQIHIVKENETVYSIAKSYGLSVDQIRSLNNLEINEIIIPYQRIYVN